MDAYTQSIHEPLATVATTLHSNLGATLTAFIADTRSRQVVYQWAAGDVEPRRESSQRLRFAYRAWLEISADSGPDVARAWFIGSNPRLGELSPAEEIRAGHFPEVRAAVTAFLQDQFA